MYITYINLNYCNIINAYTYQNIRGRKNIVVSDKVYNLHFPVPYTVLASKNHDVYIIMIICNNVHNVKYCSNHDYHDVYGLKKKNLKIAKYL